LDKFKPDFNHFLNLLATLITVTTHIRPRDSSYLNNHRKNRSQIENLKKSRITASVRMVKAVETPTEPNHNADESQYKIEEEIRYLKR